MARWLLLLVTFAAWAGTMLWVQRTFGPRPLAAEALSSQQALEAFFSERAPRKERWKIYIHPQQGMAGKPLAVPKTLPAAEWKHAFRTTLAEAEEAGAGAGELPVGVLESELKRRSETYAEQKTTMNFSLAAWVDPAMRQFLAEWGCEGKATYSMDQGLVNFSCKVKSGMGIEALMIGSREGAHMRIVMSLFQGEKKLNEQIAALPVPVGCVPSLLSPFAFRPSIHEGDKWSVAVFNSAGATDELRLESWEAQVSGKRTILFHGREAQVFEVLAQNGRDSATAFFSPDGLVLKQKWKFAELFSLTMIREEEAETEKAVEKDEEGHPVSPDR